MAVSSSKWSGGMGLWRMFVLVLLTHQPVHHWFLSQHCYYCCRRGEANSSRYGSAAPSFPPPHICDPGASPSLTSSLHHHPALPQTSTHTHTHTLVHAQTAIVRAHKFSWWSTRSGGLILKWMSTVKGTDYSAGKFICLSKRRQLKHGWVFRRQGGLSLMGKGIKSKKESLLPSDTSSCSLRANNKTHSHSSCILTLRHSQPEQFVFVALVKWTFQLDAEIYWIFEADNNIYTWE